MPMRTKQYPSVISAILYADVVGYSRLTSQDELGTHMRMINCLQIFTKSINQNNGRLIDASGDSILATFPTVASALNCALEVQNTFYQINRQLDQQKSIEYRIGIHLGEVFIDSEQVRIFGENVNIAARLQSLALAGGVSISDSAQHELNDELPIEIVFQGEKQVKNIDAPLRVYRVLFEPDPIPVTASLDLEPHKIESVIRDAGGTAVQHELVNMYDSKLTSTQTSALHTWLTVKSIFHAIISVLGINAIFNSLAQVEARRLAANIEYRHRIAYGFKEQGLEAGMAIYHSILRHWLLWLNRRFGPRRGFQFKGFDFCLVYALVYCILFFFIGLIFLGGDDRIGDLRISYMEVGGNLLKAQPPTLVFNNMEIGTIPIMLVIFIAHYFLQRSLRRLPVSKFGGAFENGLAILSAILLSILFGITLGMTGFGAGLVTLAIALGVWHIRGVAGSGIVTFTVTAFAVATLYFIVQRAESGDEFFVELSLSLHDLVRSDIEIFFLFLLLFPLVNACFDFVSWRISRRFAIALYGNRSPFGKSVLDWFLQVHKKFLRNAKSIYRFLSYVFWVLADAVVAVALLILLVGCCGFVLSMLDWLMYEKNDIYQMEQNLASMVKDPFGSGFWLSAMLFTTLIPTLMHLLAVSIGVARVLMLPHQDRMAISFILLAGLEDERFGRVCKQVARILLIRKIWLLVLLPLWFYVLFLGIEYVFTNGRVFELLSQMARVGISCAAIVIDVFTAKPVS